MAKKSFEQICELVAKKFEPLQNIDHKYLNEEGKFMYEVYDVLDDCVRMSDNLNDFVEQVRWNIEEMLKPTWYRSPEFAEENKRIAEKLRRYVRWNIEKELWENIPEFANREENK